MINSPWEIKKTSFGETLLLSSSTHMPAVPNLPSPCLLLSLPLAIHQPLWTISMLYKVGSPLTVKWSLCIADLQEHLFQQTSPSDVQLCEDFLADNKHQWKYFSCSLSKRRMGSHSIYDINKGLGKMKCLGSFVTMVTTPFGRPTDFSLLTEWFVT